MGLVDKITHHYIDSTRHALKLVNVVSSVNMDIFTIPVDRDFAAMHVMVLVMTRQELIWDQ